MTLKKAFLILLAAFVWLFGGIFASIAIKAYVSSEIGALGALVTFIGFDILFITGMGSWASAKGYHYSWGILCALLTPIAWIVLALLPHRQRDTQKKNPTIVGDEESDTPSSSAEEPEEKTAWGWVTMVVIGYLFWFVVRPVYQQAFIEHEAKEHAAEMRRSQESINNMFKDILPLIRAEHAKQQRDKNDEASDEQPAAADSDALEQPTP